MFWKGKKSQSTGQNSLISRQSRCGIESKKKLLAIAATREAEAAAEEAAAEEEAEATMATATSDKKMIIGNLPMVQWVGFLSGSMYTSLYSCIPVF